MTRVFLVLLLAVGTVTARADDKPSPAVKAILETAVAEVKKNRQEFDNANAKPLGTAREELQGLFQKLVDGGKSADAQAVLKQIETLQADVIRMASGGERPTLKPAVKTILEKAVRDVRRNREAFDKANQEPLGSARRQLQELAKQQSDEGKTKEASATLQQIETLQPDVLAMANVPTQPSPVAVIAPRPAPGRADEEVWNGHRYKVFKEKCSWHDAKKRCEELGGHLVIVDSEKEQSFVVGLLRRSGVSVDSLQNGDPTGVWIGLTDEASEGKWLWVDGSPLGYANWLKGDPSGNFKEHFTALLLHHGGAWEDRTDPDRNSTFFICEWDD